MRKTRQRARRFVRNFRKRERRMLTTGPTPMEAAKRIVMILVEILHREPGQPARLDTIQAQFLSDAWTLVDFQAGLAFAAEKRWLDLLDREAALTMQGF